ERLHHDVDHLSRRIAIVEVDLDGALGDARRMRNRARLGLAVDFDGEGQAVGRGARRVEVNGDEHRVLLADARAAAAGGGGDERRDGEGAHQNDTWPKVGCGSLLPLPSPTPSPTATPTTTTAPTPTVAQNHAFLVTGVRPGGGALAVTALASGAGAAALGGGVLGDVVGGVEAAPGGGSLTGGGAPDGGALA